MIKRILVATSLLCMCCILFAQNVQVKGKVVSENEAVEFANVVLQTKDSIFIAGGVTDSKGRFMMENIQTGSYALYFRYGIYLPDYIIGSFSCF